MVISVNNLSKYYRVHKKQPGVSGAFKNLFKREYSQAKAVESISFEIDAGELVGFIGPNGAGKTTTLKCLTGLVYPTGGEISILGHTPFNRDHAFLKQISLVMGQKNQLWWDLPAADSFLLNKAIYGVSDSRYAKTVGDLVDLLDVKDIIHVPVRKLSLGQRMKCELIAALVHTPKVLFLDEPTIGLDVVMQQKLRDFIKEYNEKYNATIILTSHYMQDVEQLCKRVIVIDRGTILYDGSLSDIVKEYAKEKVLTVTFGKSVSKSGLTAYGKILAHEGNMVSFAVQREKVSSVAAKVLEAHDVEDLTIEEISIESIIKDVFAQKTA